MTPAFNDKLEMEAVYRHIGVELESQSRISNLRVWAKEGGGMLIEAPSGKIFGTSGLLSQAELDTILQS